MRPCCPTSAGYESPACRTGLTIRNLQDLENKIIGVIVAALAVAFLGQAAGTSQPEALLGYGGGIALVIVSLAFFMERSAKRGESKEK